MPLSNHALSLARRIGMLVLAFAAMVVWVSMGSPERAADNYINEIDSIMRNDRENQGEARSAAQQQVVNGWTSRNLLALSARMEAAGSRDDDRIAALVMLLLLAVAWHSLTSPRYPRSEEYDEEQEVATTGPTSCRCSHGVAPVTRASPNPYAASRARR